MTRDTNPISSYSCFSSSSMKISSKSILSPGHHHRDPPSSATLSASLSRRLKTNRSLRGGAGAQSPMFPSSTTTKKRGFDNPEPSSPKVTCIGQVRVKTRKRHNNKRINMRTPSQRRNGEASFRRADHHQLLTDDPRAKSHNNNNQSSQGGWVHLPLTICEALRAFGSEFSCLFPCRTPSCFSNDKIEKSREEEGNNHGSCGAVFARWLVALNDDGEGGRRREIELVVGGEEEEMRRDRWLRRHATEEIDVAAVEEEKGRVSICVPPKNALLLMRCRSDPLRMNALANRLWECPVPTMEEDEDEVESVEDEETERGVRDSVTIGEIYGKIDSAVVDEKLGSTEEGDEKEKQEGHGSEIEANLVAQVREYGDEGTEEIKGDELDINGEIGEDKEAKSEEDSERIGGEGDELGDCSSSSSGSIEKTEELVLEEEDEKTEGTLLLLSEEEKETEELDIEEEEEERRISHYSSSSSVLSLHFDILEKEFEAQLLAQEEKPEQEEEEEKTEELEREAEERENLLPECLLLMRCEPKLSMEVSKETWVCTTDFVRWLPPRRRPKKSSHKTDNGGGDEPKRRSSVDVQPPRSSCSLPAQAPAPASMASLIEQRLMSAVAYEPFVLTRCKSEPMRTAAAKLVPETCFWKNRKLEPHRAATVGAAGIGF